MNHSTSDGCAADRPSVVAIDTGRPIWDRFFSVRQLRQHRRVGDLVPIQVQDGQHRPVAGRVEEFVAAPTGGERTGLRLAVTDHTRNDQVRVVERRAEGVAERVPEFAALVNAAGRFRGNVRRDATREAELLEQFLQPGRVAGDLWIHFCVHAFQVHVCHQPRPAVPRPRDVQNVQVVPLDDAVQVNVDEVQARCRAQGKSI